MKRWVKYLLLALCLAILAFTSRWWLPWLLGFVGANSDLIQGLEALVQIVFFVGAGIAGLFGWFNRQKKESRLETQISVLTEQVQKPAISGDVRTLTALGEGSVVIGGDANGIIVVTGSGNQVMLPADQVDPEVLLRAYYRSLADECRHLPLGTVDPRFIQPLHEGEVSLADVYTDLDVVSPPLEELTEAGEGKLPFHSLGLRLARAEGEGRIPLLEAVASPATRLAVLLGDPGSGKTTFVNYLGYLLADAAARGQTAPLPDELKSRLPVRLLLRHVSKHIPCDAARGTASMLWDALQSDIAERLGTSAAERLLPYLQNILLSRPGLLLLDGLDEVPEAGRRRQCLLESIQVLSGSLTPTSRVLLTARPYAYADPDWRLPRFQALALAPFSQEQVERFIERWHQAVRPAMGWTADTAQGRGQRLLHAFGERPYLGDLASRPLLLTLMCTLHSSWGTLPEDRADLYEESVRLLLSRWQRGRENIGPDGKPVEEPGISRALNLGEERIRLAIEKLAYEIHTRQGQESDREEVPADISQSDILGVFAPLLPEDFNPAVLLRYLETRAGLLMGRREGVYSFPHRSFQEYLAACHLTASPNFALELRELFANDPQWWREVCLLGLGKTRRGGPGGVLNALQSLLPESTQEVDAPEDSHWRLAVLVGQAMLELRLAEQIGNQTLFQALHRRVTGWLEALIESGKLTPAERLDGGSILGRLGDPRFDPQLNYLPRRFQKQPEILVGFMPVPAGPFLMGSLDEDKEADNDERPQHTLELPLFYVARYPVTNAQYGSFISTGGYEKERYWTEQGWAWRQGAPADLSPIDHDEIRKNYENWLSGRTKEQRSQPFSWGDPIRGTPNRPVVGISWYEALAYTNWLQEMLIAVAESRLIGDALSSLSRAFWNGLAQGRLTAKLPSEAEWEKAARGPDGRAYPWSMDWQPDAANTVEAGLRQASPVGMFPAGISPSGALDMTGNVWEWTTSRWGQSSIYKPDYLYPYMAQDGREDLSGPDLRVVRGGSWIYDRGNARCAARLRSVPDYFGYGFGFRVVVSLAVSES